MLTQLHKVRLETFNYKFKIDLTSCFKFILYEDT